MNSDLVYPDIYSSAMTASLSDVVLKLFSRDERREGERAGKGEGSMLIVYARSARAFIVL